MPFCLCVLHQLVYILSAIHAAPSLSWDSDMMILLMPVSLRLTVESIAPTISLGFYCGTYLVTRTLL